MLNWFFEILAPSTFTKGIYKYDEGDYHSASRLFKKAAKWMPELKEDGLFDAYLLLVNYHLGGEINVEGVNTAIEKLSKSTFKGHNSYLKAEAELNGLLKE